VADSTQRLRSGGGKSGSPVLQEPFEHLIQHIKQTDPMLYEALRKLTKGLTESTTNLNDVINNNANIVIQDKCTFGLVRALTVSNGLTLDYICRKPGSFLDWAAKITTQAPTGANAILDVKKSTDDGLTWNSIFLPNTQIILPAGSLDTVFVKKFAIEGIDIGNLLRIDCLQIGSGDPGKGIEVVGRWTAKGSPNPDLNPVKK
jgi:hypothetical protein